MLNKVNYGIYDKSIFDEFKASSIKLRIGVILILFLCTWIYVGALLPTRRVVKIIDYAEALSEEDENKLNEAAKVLSSARNINVIIITTRDSFEKEEEIREYCKNEYKEALYSTETLDSTGTAIVMDMTDENSKSLGRIMYKTGRENFEYKEIRAEEISQEANDCVSIIEAQLEFVKSYKSYNSARISRQVIGAPIPFIIAYIVYIKSETRADTKPRSIRQKKVFDKLVSHKEELISCKSKTERRVSRSYIH